MAATPSNERNINMYTFNFDLCMMYKLTWDGRKQTHSRKTTTEQLALYLVSQKFMRELWIIKLMVSLGINSLNISKILEKGLGNSIFLY